MKYSVIIAERNEPDLANTVKNIEANSSAKVIVMSDSQGLGPQAMRDRGIGLAAGSDVVIVMDGHMRVKAGTLDAMADWCMANPKSVAVPRCLHSHVESWDQQPYSGASFAWMDSGATAREPQSFCAKWRTEHTIGQIPCIMGACYGMTRDWYMEGLRRPWQFGTGWGCDEEILSAATWLMGGTVDLLPFSVWHQAREPSQVPYRITDAQTYGVMANRTRILDMLPMSEDERKELVMHLLPALCADEWRKVGRINERYAHNVTEYRNFLQGGPMSWDDFKANMIGVQTVKEAKMKDLRQFAKDKGITVPFGCKKGQLLSMLQDTPDPTEQVVTVEPAKVMANWGADETNNAGKRCCVHCDGGSTIVTRTMQAGRLVQRYRLCNDCNKRFPTREILATA